MATYLESMEAQRKKREGNVMGGVWGAVRSELNALAAGNPEGRQIYEQGRDAILRGPQSPFGPEIGSAEQVGRGVQAAKDFLGTAFSKEAFTTSAADRNRRLQMAQFPLEVAHRRPVDAPVMAKSQQAGEQRPPELGLRNEGPPEQAAHGAGERPDQRSMPPAAVSTAVRASGTSAAPSSDPRKRYLDMARMSLEQREAYLNKLPEGQRPIHAIRGTKESWYSPGMSREFATIPEAMSGIQGRPTYESEEERAERAAGRAAVSSRQSARFAHEKSMKQDEFAHEEKMAKEYGVGVGKGRKGSILGADGDEWKPEKFTLPDGTEAFQLFSKSGKTVTVKPNPESVGGFLPGMNLDDSPTRQAALDMVMGVKDPAEQNRLFMNQPKHVQEAILQAIKERKERESKK